MRAIGIDIGTTTICAIVLDAETGEVIKSVTEDNNSFIETEQEFEKIQNPSVILETALSIVERLSAEYAPIDCIGISGQMHGIVYLDEHGDAVSNLYIWQDSRGNLEYKDGMTYAEYLTETTGYKMATGFGLTTHFYNLKNNLIPSNAVKFCTIHDFFAMKLTGNTAPAVNPTNAASFGLFDIKNSCFDTEACRKAGIDLSYLPEVKDGFCVIGKTADGIPVAAAIGDNQASFLGSVDNMEESLLVNVGTGSQISLCVDGYVECPGVETRPCVEGKSLLVGSSLCGGRAFAILEEFFRDTVKMVTGEEIKSAYPGLDRLLAEAGELENPLNICTKFSGTRDNPKIRGGVENLGIDNFTPQHFMLGVLNGMSSELYDMYAQVKESGKVAPKELVGSGNGLRKNTVLKNIFAQKFNMKLKIPAHKEEASYGGALFALVAAGCIEDISHAQSIIKYE